MTILIFSLVSVVSAHLGKRENFAWNESIEPADNVEHFKKELEKLTNKPESDQDKEKLLGCKFAYI